MRDPEHSEIYRAETLLLEHFKTQPFHNLHILFGEKLLTKPLGGTCSDKTLSFVADAKKQGFDIALHSAFIDGQEIHRLARFIIGNRQYFADVGNGWPSLKLYPTDRPIECQCFGMKFRSEVDMKNVTIFHEKNGEETEQMIIPRASRSETEILNAIRQRFTSGIVYPFSNSVRYSMVVGDRFLFLRGNRLEIYSTSGFEVIARINTMPIPQILESYFGTQVDFADDTL